MKKYFEKPALILAGFFAGLLLLEVLLQGYGVYLDFARTELEPEIEGKIRILAIGESTTDPVFAPEKKAWTYFLEKKLNEGNPAKPFVVINKARSGTSTDFILEELPQNLEKYKPQLIISMMGINDLTALEFLHDRSFFSRLKLVRIIKNALPAPIIKKQPDPQVTNSLWQELKKIKSPGEKPEEINKWMKTHPEHRWFALHHLSHKNFWLVRNSSEEKGILGDYSFSFQYAREALIENPLDESSLQLLIFSSINPDRKKEARTIMKEMIRQDYKPSATIAPWLELISFREDKDLLNLMQEKGFNLRKMSNMDNIRENHIKLLNLARKHNSRLAVMAYPTTNIRLYQHLFIPEYKFEKTFLRDHSYLEFPEPVLKDEAQKIIFISNENFPRDFNKDYYLDRMVNLPEGGFGHTTMKGHELIGDNAYLALKDHINFKQASFAPAP